MWVHVRHPPSPGGAVFYRVSSYSLGSLLKLLCEGIRVGGCEVTGHGYLVGVSLAVRLNWWSAAVDRHLSFINVLAASSTYS